MRLPTEWEWEKAARGGRQGRLFPWGGDTIQHTRANYYAATNIYAYDTSLTQGYHPNYQAGGTPYTSPVRSFPANGYGLHDSAGNVSEWCWDWYGAYSAGFQLDPHGPENGGVRVVRGGSWIEEPQSLRVGKRFTVVPSVEGNNLGFRCAKGL